MNAYDLLKKYEREFDGAIELCARFAKDQSAPRELRLEAARILLSTQERLEKQANEDSRRAEMQHFPKPPKSRVPLPHVPELSGRYDQYGAKTTD